MPAARASSGPCSTTLVEPPIAMATSVALRCAAAVTMSRGRRSRAAGAGRELLDPARVLRGGTHHVQGLHAAGGDERLHGVVGEHPAAAPVTGRGLYGDAPSFPGRIGRRLEA